MLVIIFIVNTCKLYSERINIDIQYIITHNKTSWLTYLLKFRGEYIYSIY